MELPGQLLCLVAGPGNDLGYTTLVRKRGRPATAFHKWHHRAGAIRSDTACNRRADNNLSIETEPVQGWQIDSSSESLLTSRLVVKYLPFFLRNFALLDDRP